MMPILNDADDDEHASDWKDDYDALRKVDITIEPVQSNEIESIGDAYDDYDADDDRSHEQEEECSCNEGGEDSICYDNYGRDVDMTFDNYEGNGIVGEGAGENESYKDEERKGFDNQTVDESCFEGVTFQQNGITQDENNTQEVSIIINNLFYHF